jgi:hypothetical protein
MRIASSTVQLTSSHLVERTSTRSESLQGWIGEAAPGQRTSAGATRPEADAAAPASTAPDPATGGADGADAPERLSARDALDLAILRKIFGLERDLTRFARDARDAYQAAPAAPAAGAAPAEKQGWGLRYDLSETTLEHESTRFAAQAQVTTADGRSIAVQTALAMERTRVTTNEVHVRAGDAAKVDPLVLNLDGGAASFSGRTALDLDGDGKEESIARLDPGSAYLALDRNGNGKVDSGAELFGPSTGSGFGELAALDQDQSGWIDEGDAAFGSLRLWNQGSGALQTLQAAGVGAIYTRAAATAFDVKDDAGATQASVAQTGLFLREDGTAGTVQHVDLVA